MSRIVAALALVAALATSAAALVIPANSIQPLKHPETGNTFCTAFSIKPGRYMTAKHCVTQEDGELQAFTVGNWGDTGEVIATFGDLDIAIFESALRVPPLKLAATTPQIGDALWVYGYGYGDKRPLAFFGRVAALSFFDEFLVIGMNIFPGHSGSPVMREEGNDVVGVGIVYIDPGGVAGATRFVDIKKTAKYWGS